MGGSTVESKPKKVSRVVPILFDMIILGLQLTIFGSYTYMTFFHGDLDYPSCKTDMNTNYPIQSSYQTGIDVTDKFARAIRWGFWMSFLNIARAAVA